MAGAIREAATVDGRPQVITGAGAVLAMFRRRQDIALLVSDARPARPIAILLGARRTEPRRVVRLWWNGADEITAARGAGHPQHGPPETHVCFFQEVLNELAGTDLDVVQVPYAFSPPRPRRDGGEVAKIGYTAEVDISDRCFDALGLDGVTLRKASTETWRLTDAVVAGEITMIEADERLRVTDAEFPELHRTSLWALRNRVRYTLLKRIAATFPGRIALRGSDWNALGFDAHPTSFRRRTRMADYRRYRVSLDLGSKSTHAALYPRTADIISVAGGIVQLDTGAELPDYLGPLQARRARSLGAIQDTIDDLLRSSAANVLDQNIEIQHAYARVRRSAGESLLQAIRSG